MGWKWKIEDFQVIMGFEFVLNILEKQKDVVYKLT